MPFGAELQPGGAARFRLWAPAQKCVALAIEGERKQLQMEACGDGWHELTTTRAQAGTCYRYLMQDGLPVPDPASRFQPMDVHGPSEVIDAGAYRWSDQSWHGRPWNEAVLYELHIGTFTAEGTYQAAAGKFLRLQELGVTAIEIMPVGDFPGRFNWGYDGVLLYAPDSSYGRPEDLKAMVEAAHASGLMVLLDVVYNHFGPEGNYLRSYAPQFFTDRHKTPWGDGINFDGPDARPVREFVIHNALYWIEEYHLDGLRLDAVHAIRDDSTKQVVAELAERVRAQVKTRPIHLVAENDDNVASLLERDSSGEPKWFTAQWNDDVHHVLHTAATGEDAGYYSGYRGDTEKLGRALAQGFAYQGEVMPYRGRPKGEPSAHLPPTAFIAFLQNHDQAGNRAFGERIGQLAGGDALRAITAVNLLLPQIPLLFMGQEWNAPQPFPFFCDFSGELAQVVREGRRNEFASFAEYQDPANWNRIPDPQAVKTFQSAKLDWEEIDEPRDAAWREWHCRILRVRQERIVPILASIGEHAGRYELHGHGAVTVRWRVDPDGDLTLAANLSAEPKTGFPAPGGSVLWQEGAYLGAPWSVCWWLK